MSHHAGPVRPSAARAARLVVLAAFALIIALGISGRRPSAQKNPPPAGVQVRTLGPREKPAVSPGEKGATYYWIEAQASRVTMKYADAVAVTERVAGGDMHTRLTDTAGNELATLNTDRVDSSADVLSYRAADGGVLRAVSQPGARATLDWANRQTYSLWKDKLGGDGRSLEWQEGVIRPAGAARRSGERDIVEFRTEWPGDLVATAVRNSGQRRHVLTGQPLAGEVTTSRLTRHGVEIGETQWYIPEQVLLWSIPGLTEGEMDASGLDRIGGWPFAPDLAWINLQTIGFHHFHTLAAAKGAVACRQPQRGWTARVIELWAPTVSANEPGCDGLHWLDSSIFRPCCDSHDYCYEAYGCSSRSWWEFWSGWKCDGCNLMVVSCFGGRAGPFYRWY